MGRANSLEKIVMLGMIEGRRRSGQQRTSLTHGHEFEQAPDDEEQVCLVCYSPWGHKVLDTTVQLNNKLGTT